MSSQIRILFFMLVLPFFHLNSLKAQTEDNSRGYIVNIGDMAPDFETTLVNGKTFKLSEQRGKLVMLQFTASWCGVCRKEMPFIESEIWKKLQDQDFILVGIDRDEPLEKIQEFATQTKITYPLALDPGAEIFSKYALKDAGVTRNVIIDAEGKIIYLTRLFNREEFDEMKKVIFHNLK